MKTQRLKDWLYQLLCRHPFWLSDYLPIQDENGIRFVLDYCSRCGKREKHGKQ